MSFSFPCLARTRFVPGACPRLRRAHLRWAIRARAVPAQGCLCRRARHPRCGLWCVGRPQSGAPRWFLGPASHLRWAIRAAAPSNSRTRRPGAGLFVSAGASPAMQPVVRRLPAKRCAPLVPWPSLAPAVGNSRGCAEQFARLRRAIRAAAPSNSRTRRPGAGLTKAANMSPAMRPVVRRLPVKAVRPVGSLAQSRTHAVCFGCGLLFPGAQTGPLFPQARGWFVFVLGSAPRPFFYSIKQAQACKAMRSLQVVQLFVYINFTYPVPSLVVCGKGPSFRSGFPHFQPSFHNSSQSSSPRVHPQYLKIMSTCSNTTRISAKKEEKRSFL